MAMAGPAELLRIERREEGGVVVLRLAGELDLSTSGRLESAAQQAAGGPARRVVVDLTETTFVDSTGLAAMLAVARRLGERHVGLETVAPHGHEARLLIELAQAGAILGLAPA